MNFYFSSSFTEKDNTKICFQNNLPPIPFDNKSINLKSLRFHNTLSLIKNIKIPHIKSSQKDTLSVNSNIWRRETGQHIVINDFSLILTTNRKITYNINFKRKT